MEFDKSLLTKIPAHVAIIMDGNGRWAKQRGLPRNEGHRAGTENIRTVLTGCAEFGIKVLTLYAFSTENWGRPEAEVHALLSILEQTITREVPELHKNGVQLRHIGSLDGVSDHVQEAIQSAIELTKHNDRIVLNVAFNYGGRAEILNAAKQIIAAGIAPSKIDEKLFESYLYTAGLPDPDLVIRTAGEMRLSNFLIWQAAYAEYFSTPTYWPDFDQAELYQALVAFSHRQRRFGKLENV